MKVVKMFPIVSVNCDKKYQFLAGVSAHFIAHANHLLFV